jgi:hypothetical protein
MLRGPKLLACTVSRSPKFVRGSRPSPEMEMRLSALASRSANQTGPADPSSGSRREAVPACKCLVRLPLGPLPADLIAVVVEVATNQVNGNRRRWGSSGTSLDAQQGDSTRH